MAWGFSFPLLPVSELAHSGSFALLVPMVPEGPTTLDTEKVGAVGASGVYLFEECCFLTDSQDGMVTHFFFCHLLSG